MSLRLLIPTLILPLCCVACESPKTPANDTEEMCTEVGCDDDDEYAMFALDRSESDWQGEQGSTYTFTLSWDGGSASCVVVVPEYGSCDSGIGIAYPEDDSGDTWTSLEGVYLDTFPGPVTLTIERDGALVLEQEYIVEPVSDYPNGRDCPPECVSWSDTVDSW